MAKETRSNCCNARVRNVTDAKGFEGQNKLLCLGCKKIITHDSVHDIIVKAAVKISLQKK